MSHLTFDRHGVSVSLLNDLSLSIRSGIAASLHDDYSSQINALQLSEDDGFNEQVEGYDSLLPLWGNIIKSSNIGLVSNIRERDEHIRLQIYTVPQVDVEDVIIDGVLTKQYSNRRGGELLLRVLYTCEDRSLTYTKYWE